MKILDAVILLVDLPEHGLRAGDVGAVVEVYSQDAVEVEFVGPTGETRALLTLDTGALRVADRRDVLTVRRSA